LKLLHLAAEKEKEASTALKGLNNPEGADPFGSCALFEEFSSVDGQIPVARLQQIVKYHNAGPGR
jgi:hypothetical protein